MWNLPCRVVSPIPDDPTDAVTVEIVDAEGHRFTFTDKLVIFRSGEANARDAIRCQLIRAGKFDGKIAFWIDTTQPDHVTADQDEHTQFVVRNCFFEANLEPYRARYADIPRERPDVSIDIDFLQHRIALALGLLPADTAYTDVKWMYWTAPSDVGDFTLAVIRELRERGILEAVEDDDTLLHFTGK